MSSHLLMFCEPGGQGYEFQLFGSVVARKEEKASTASASRKQTLLSNEHWLAWGGVDIGTTV